MSEFEDLLKLATTRAYCNDRSARRLVRRDDAAKLTRSNGTPLGEYEQEVRRMALAPLRSMRDRLRDESDAWLIAQRHDVNDLDVVRAQEDGDEEREDQFRYYHANNLREERIDPRDMTVYDGLPSEVIHSPKHRPLKHDLRRGGVAHAIRRARSHQQSEVYAMAE